MSRFISASEAAAMLADQHEMAFLDVHHDASVAKLMVPLATGLTLEMIGGITSTWSTFLDGEEDNHEQCGISPLAAFQLNDDGGGFWGMDRCR